MFEITDETDKFTGDRRINALLQPQESETPKLQFSATIAGHQFPELAGTGSYHFIMEWENAKEISGLDGALALAPEASTTEFSLFNCLIDGKPVKFEHIAISKTTALTDEDNPTLFFIVSVTADDLKQISAADLVEFRAYNHEFTLDEDVRENIGKLLPLVGSVKTVSQMLNEQQVREESKLQSLEGIGNLLGIFGLVIIVLLIIKFFG